VLKLSGFHSPHGVPSGKTHAMDVSTFMICSFLNLNWCGKLRCRGVAGPCSDCPLWLRGDRSPPCIAGLAADP